MRESSGSWSRGRPVRDEPVSASRDDGARPQVSSVSHVEYRGQRFSRRKEYFHGTHRTCPPEETLARVRPYFREIGLTRLANITGLDRIGLPVVLSVRPNAKALAVDAGKGFSLEAATVSAAMECFERHHAGEFRPVELYLPYEQLAKSYHVIPREHLLLTKNSLFDVRIPERWILGWDIVHQKEVAVPAFMVLLGDNRRSPPDLFSFQPGSNGLSAGNDFLEAVCSGLYEVVERDSVACWTLAEQRQVARMRRVRLDTIEHPLVREELERLRAAEVRPLLYDCTTDTDVPTFIALIYDLVSRSIGIYRGYGAHLDAGIAMLRALCEAVQSRLVYISGSRDDFFRHSYNRMKGSDNEKTISKLEQTPEVVDAAELSSRSTGTFEGDILAVVERLQKVGLQQVIVLDLSMPGIDGVSVVKVMVPGLEGYPYFSFFTPGKRVLSFLKVQELLLKAGPGGVQS